MSKLLATSNKLPLEIIEPILRLLPAKSLGRFKSVSKTWNSLISDPQFIKIHLLRRQPTKLILVSYTKSLYSVDLNELLPYLNNDDTSTTGKELSFRSPRIWWEKTLGSCNGLVLAEDVLVNDTMFLVNPTTREVWKVPTSPFPRPAGPLECFLRYGFGYDASTDDYKVVSVSFWDPEYEHDPDCTDTYVSVYSLHNNSWRKLPSYPYDLAGFHVVSGVLVNQNFHWLASIRPRNSSSIVAFSFATEEFNEIKLPDSIENEEAECYFDMAVLGGKLALYLSNGEDYDLWVMEEYGVGESWTRVCVETGPVRPLCFVEGSDRDILLGDEVRVLVYNLDEKICRNVRIVGGPKREGVEKLKLKILKRLGHERKAYAPCLYKFLGSYHHCSLKFPKSPPNRIIVGSHMSMAMLE
ncbi:hypothetical protein L1987_65642 [Smallanthus sonchifolius]|uniref:Uncharacterized protein n=1 Tax=Smallanthus sonchifolius TaxID=185202 RepID=A0ACB9BV14_9ASTR|nr:hypothetical protein L1987_65642 [Smallanthus sonchifolius]